jgi:small subunit ribosomal protein S6
MRKYETLLLFSPELTTENRKEILDNLGAIVAREQGQTLVLDEWGSRELAYAVNKFTRGHYVRLEYAGPSPLIAELERNIRITDGILKFVTVKLDENFQAGEE